MKSVVIERTVKGLDVTVVGVKTGRPVNPNRARQIRLAELEAKAKLNGGVVKRGRPAMIKVNEVMEVAK